MLILSEYIKVKYTEHTHRERADNITVSVAATVTLLCNTYYNNKIMYFNFHC